ncbi:MAG: hypothetical protein U0570_08505 [Phycisphaerales bacterium]
MVEASGHDDDFYVGYLPAGRRLMNRPRLVAVAVSALAGALAALLPLTARDSGTGHWDDGNLRSFTGVFTRRPYAALHLTQATGSVREGTSLLVVEMGKFGGGRRKEPSDGRVATLRGYLLDRNGQMMIELEPGEQAVGANDNEGVAPPDLDEGSAAFEGEIVDSKCWMGAMKPGEGRVHRECAIRCISGGIPPVLVSRAADGSALFTLISTDDGGRLSDEALALVGLPVRVHGQLHRVGQLRVLHVDSSGIKPITSTRARPS